MALTVPPTRGHLSGTVVGAPTDVVGLFDKYGRALEFTGAGTDRIDLTIGATEALAGSSFVTVTAWVKVDSTAAEQTILVLVDGANAERLWCGIGSVGQLEVRARARNADTLRTFTTGVTPAIGWHHFGFIVDVPGDLLTVAADGEYQESGAADFGTNKWFNDDANAAGNRIGINAAASPASQWNGKIHSVRIHRRRLSEGEFSRIWELGKRGVYL